MAHVARRWLRPNNILGRIIPFLLALLVWKGSQLVLVHTAYELLYITQGRPIVASLYAVHFILTLSYLLYAFKSIYFAAPSHSVPPREPPDSVLDGRVVYECDSEGTPLRCFKDGCAGSWKAIRTRHCNDCGVCRTEFDHHCAFVASCIARETLKPFICFLYSVIPLIGVAIIPLVLLQVQSVREVVRATWETDWMRDNWWKRKYSWTGGPIWRYSTGLILGYYRYPSLTPPRAPLFLLPSTAPLLTSSPTATLATPRLSTLLIVTSAVFVWFIALAMIITTTRQTLSGISTVQVERSRRWALERAKGEASTWDARIRLWVPLKHEFGEGREGEKSERGTVLKVEPGIPLFDLGKRENWRRVMGEEWWLWFVPWNLDDGRLDGMGEMSPKMVEMLRVLAAKQS